MNKKFSIVGCFAFSLLLITSCKKETPAGIKIRVDWPEANATVSVPADLSVTFDGGKNLIHDISIRVFETADTTAEILNYTNHVEVDYFNVLETLYANITVPTNFTIKVTAGEGNVTGNYSHTFTLTP